MRLDKTREFIVPMLYHCTQQICSRQINNVYNCCSIDFPLVITARLNKIKKAFLWNRWFKPGPVYMIIYTLLYFVHLHVTFYLPTYLLEIVVTVEILVTVVTIRS